MSARKASSQDFIPPVSVRAGTTQLELPASGVKVRKNGIEFRSQNPIPVWTEMTVAMQVPQEPKKVTFNGVVVVCDGSRHAGYAISMLYTSVSKQALAKLATMARVS